MCTDLMTASGLRSLLTRPSTRRDRNGSSIATTPARASSVIARPEVSSIPTVPGSSRSIRLSILAASKRASTTPATSYPVIRSSSSKLAPARPPRFIEATTTLSSSAPSSSRSSAISAVASRPSTPGRASAARSRSSMSVRLFIAAGRPWADSAPRAGWSAATSMSRPSSGRKAGRRLRAASARRMACGSRLRSSVTSAYEVHTGGAPSVSGTETSAGDRAVSDTGPLQGGGDGGLDMGIDLGGGRHRGGALQPGGDDRPGGVGVAQQLLQGQPGEQAVRERAAERVARAEAVDDLDRGGRDDDPLGAGLAEDAARALLDDGELHPGVEQRVGGAVGVGLADGDLALLAVADGDGHVGEGRPHLGRGLLRRGPEHGPVVEVEHGVPAAAPGLPRRVVGRPAGLLGQAGDRRPEQPGVADGREVKVLRADLQVRGGGPAVEVQREVVGREDLAEGDRRGVRGV